MNYLYKCDDCGAELREDRAVKDRNVLPRCLECGAEEMPRQIENGAGWILKGAGFHSNDYPRKKGT